MNTIAERIMEIVEKENMSKSEFARRINVTPAYISKLGKNPDAVPSDSTIADICREFCVNEVWLRTGEGNMFTKISDDDEYSLNLGKLSREENQIVRNAVRYLANADSEKLKVVEEFMRECLGLKKGE